MPISNALYGLCVCRLQYTPIAPQFLSGKRTIFVLRWCSRLGVRGAFFGLFLASGLYCSQALSTSLPLAANASR